MSTQPTPFERLEPGQTILLDICPTRGIEPRHADIVSVSPFENFPLPGNGGYHWCAIEFMWSEIASELRAPNEQQFVSTLVVEGSRWALMPA